MRNYSVRITAIVCLLISSTLFGLSLNGSYIPNIAVGKNPEKEIHHAIYGSQQGKIIETLWSAFGQTDLVAFGNSQEYMDIYIDGTAGTPMFRFNGDFKNPALSVNKLKTEFPGYFPFFFLKEVEKETALIIGPGGGRDILLAVMGGVQKITAIEVNKDIVEMVRKYSWYNGHIFNGFDFVDIVIDEGRNFLRRQKDTYDIIVLSLPVTNSSRSREGYALTENFLLTTDSIGDYLTHLTDEGRVVVVGHGDLSMLRLLSISLAALRKRGVDTTEAMKHIYMLGSGLYPVFVLKKTPFLREEVVPRFKTVLESDYDLLSSYFPHIQQRGRLNPALMSLESGRSDIHDVVREAKQLGHDISPVSDNSPFFYKFENGIPRPVSRVFKLSVVATFLVMMVPMFFIMKSKYKTSKRSNTKRETAGNPIPYVVIFLMMGLGFMMVEISLIQRFVLFLGKPVLSLIVLLFSLLGGAGIGSTASGQVTPSKIAKWGATASILAAITLLIYAFALPLILDYFLGLDITFRVLVAVMVLIPLGIVMGFPFPLAIQSLKEHRIEHYIPWMWGINGISSVLGSTATVIVAIYFGFTQVLVVGMGCYLTVSLMFKFARHRPQSG
jgi:hypothetical protein